MIRGTWFEFDLVVINLLIMILMVERSHAWEVENLNQAIFFLTSGNTL